MTRTARNTAKLFSLWPLAILAVCFACGITTASYCGNVSIWVWLALSLIPAGAAFAVRTTQYATALLCIAFLFGGAFCFSAAKGSVAPDRIRAFIESKVLPTYGIVELTGVISGPVELTPYGRRFQLAVRSVSFKGVERHASGTVIAFVTEKTSSPDDLAYGSLIRFTCVLEREDDFRDPGVVSNIARMDLNGVDASARIKSPMLIEHLGDEPAFLPLAFVYQQRSRAVAAFKRHLSPSTAGVLAASLLGDRSLLDKATADVYREGGTFHVLVISGLHITFIAAVLLLIARFFTRRRWLHFAVAIVPLWIYTIAVGAELPVVRASLMITAGLLGYAMYRTKGIANQLGLAAVILLAWKPASLFDASFQLTIASVAAIALFAIPVILKLKSIGAWMPSAETPFPPNIQQWLRKFCEMLYWNPTTWERHQVTDLWSANVDKSPLLGGKILGGPQRFIRYIFEALFVSVAVQLAILPLSVIYFHRISIGSVFSNLWVGFFLAIESFAAVFGIGIAAVSETLARPLFAVAEICNSLNLLIPEAISNLAFFSFRLPTYSGAASAIYIIYAIVVAILVFACVVWNPFRLLRDTVVENGVYAGAIAACALAAIIALHPFSAPSKNGRLRADIIDVGQGDAIFITFPNGETMLVDGGGRHLSYPDEKDQEAFQADTSNIGERVVSPVLWAKGYSRIDYLVASHADIDHTGGLIDVVNSFAIGKTILGRLPADDPELAELKAVLDSKHVPTETLGRGRVLDIGGVRVEILYPAGDVAGPSDNDHSLVMRLVFGSRALLLTADIERNAEQELLASGTQLNSDVIKVAHHGSRTSSTADFIAATKAAWAVISVGRHSQFGHPHQEVVSAWEDSGAAVLTTGGYGMITIQTDGREMAVSSFITPESDR
ncbi:MAG: ComEC/Rec2 family competence protein [Acidobacteria bacterium]|nr:ComEC/Rec2 family competence protein [Acidobacteriota bacterium]